MYAMKALISFTDVPEIHRIGMADQLHRNSDHGALLTQTMRQTSESSREAGCFAMDTQSKLIPPRRVDLLTDSVEDDFFGRRALSISDMDGSRKIGSCPGSMRLPKLMEV